MARIGIYGGSFNPIHFGHMGLARWLVEHTELDEVWLTVSPRNPLKDSTVLADDEQRLEQVREAIKGIKGLKVCDIEFTLPRPSYTANTLRALSRDYPQHTFTLIIGEDNLAILDRWREYQFILDNYPVWVYPRHTLPSNHETKTFHPAPVLIQGAPYFDISSTQIRNKFA